MIFFGELFNRNAPLAWTGMANLALFFILLAVMPFETRTVMGINLWIKPAKFAISVVIFTWTMAWLLHDVRSDSWFGFITWGIAAAMIAEMIPITVQAARGVQSHFNITTPLDGAVFSFMGAAIFFNTLLLVMATAVFFRTETGLAAAYLWGIRLGLIISILASIEGGYMAARLQHSVMVADGGAGLPFVNWSTKGGDLRVAHFVGLHALQLLPLAGWLLYRFAPQQATAATLGASLLYAAFVILLFVRAMQGVPLVAR
ncbi:MAG: hypothetical protein IAF08_14590 [Rhizobacter sp.]|nr:hypothetical protein [Chlorobiales bacterium]